METAVRKVMEKKKNTRNISKEKLFPNKTQKGPNLSVEEACWCLWVQCVICSTADLPLWSVAEPPTDPGRWRWEARENVEKATKVRNNCEVQKIQQQQRNKQNMPVNFHLVMSKQAPRDHFTAILFGVNLNLKGRTARHCFLCFLHLVYGGHFSF